MVACWVDQSDGDIDVQVLDVATNKVRYMHKGPSNLGRYRAIQLSRDSRWIVVAFSTGVVVWETATGRKSCVVKLDLYEASVIFSSNSQLLALGSISAIEIWDVATGKRKHKLSKAEFPFCGPITAFSPNSQRLAVADQRGVTVWDTATGQAISALTPCHRFYFGRQAIEFSPDRRWLAYGYSFDRLLVLWDMTTNQEHPLTTDDGQRWYQSLQVGFSPNSRILVSVDNAHPSGIWDTTTGKRLHEFESSAKFAISPDSRLVVWLAADSIQLWDVAAREERCLMSNVPPVEELVFSSCGKYLITDCGTLSLSKSSSAHLSSSKDWLQEGGRNLVCINPDYRRDMAFVAGDCVVFKNGRDSILQVDTSSNFRVG